MTRYILCAIKSTWMCQCTSSRINEVEGKPFTRIDSSLSKEFILNRTVRLQLGCLKWYPPRKAAKSHIKRCTKQVHHRLRCKHELLAFWTVTLRCPSFETSKAYHQCLQSTKNQFCWMVVCERVSIRILLC